MDWIMVVPPCWIVIVEPLLGDRRNLHALGPALS